MDQTLDGMCYEIVLPISKVSHYAFCSPMVNHHLSQLSRVVRQEGRTLNGHTEA